MGFYGNNFSYGRRNYPTPVSKSKAIDPEVRSFLAASKDPFLHGMYEQLAKRGLSEKQIEIAEANFQKAIIVGELGLTNPEDVIAFLATVTATEGFLADMKAKAGYALLSENMIAAIRKSRDNAAKLASADLSKLPTLGKKTAFVGTVTELKTKWSDGKYGGEKLHVRFDAGLGIDMVVTMPANGTKAVKFEIGNRYAFEAKSSGLYGSALYANSISKIVAA